MGTRRDRTWPFDGTAPCPCGLGPPYAACCGRFHAGDASAPTAELLMRSRYTAFAVRDAAYLMRTWHPTTRPTTIDLDPRQEWTGLVILDRAGGGMLDTEGTVTFRASYRVGGTPGELLERSRFVRDNGAWVYVAALPSLTTPGFGH